MRKRNSRSYNPSEGQEEEILYTPKGRCEGESGSFEGCCFRTLKTFWLAHADYFESFGKTKMKFAGFYER